MAEEVISGSRWKSVAGAVVCAALAAAAIGMILRPSADLNPALAWGLLAACGFVGLPLFVLLAFRPQQIIIGPEGFEHVAPFGARNKVGWHEVAEFFVWRVEYSAHVAYRPLDARQNPVLSLGGGWQGGSQKVVDILNRRRQAAAA